MWKTVMSDAFSQFDIGLLTGILVGEGSFGGDGRQPAITLRMHVKHALLFEWLVKTWGGRLYGPYDHGGRRYYQWFARGRYLRDVLVPILDESLSPALDQHTWERYQVMKERYKL